MTMTNPLTTLWGKLARDTRRKRGQQQKLRFLCPNCLHFGAFAFACGECWSELPEYADDKNAQTCSYCQQSLHSANGNGVRAYCQQCKASYDRTIYHQRRVRVLATLRPADSQSLYRAISGQVYPPQGGKGYVYDDGAWLTFVLTLSDFIEEAQSLPPTHPLWEARSIWLDVSASNPTELALELGDAVDRFAVQAKLTEAQRRTVTVCVQQAEAAPALKPVLETRFGKARYKVTAADYLAEKLQTKTVTLGKIGHNSTLPALIAALQDNDSGVRGQAAKVFRKIGDATAVPALIAALKNQDSGVRGQAAKVLGEIGDATAVSVLIAALQDTDESVRKHATEALGKTGKSAVPALSAALQDSDESVRYGAAEALGKTGDATAVPALSAALKDSNWSVCTQAAVALGKIGDVTAVPALQAANSKFHEPDFLCFFCLALHKLGVT